MQKHLSSKKRLAKGAETLSQVGMRMFTLLGLVSGIARFFSTLNTRRNWALAGSIALGLGSPVSGGEPPPSVIATRSGNVVTVTFQPTGTRSTFSEYAPLFGGQYLDLSSYNTLFSGQLLSITANLRLESYGLDIAGGTRALEPDPNNPNYNPEYLTEVTDLAVYIGGLTPGTPPNFSGGLLQLGGDTQGINNVAVGGYQTWGSFFSANSFNTYAGDTLPGIVANVSSLNISLSPSVPEVWLVNTYSPSVATASFGRWSGTIDFTFASSGGSGVPDASRTALLLAPGTLLLLGLAGRSRRRG
jgi:hypothetical protein